MPPNAPCIFLERAREAACRRIWIVGKANSQVPAVRSAAAKIAKTTAHGLPVTTIDVSGAYSGMAGPGVAPVAAQGYQASGAIIEGPGGTVFIKYTGPAKKMAANQKKFQQMVESFDKAGK